jgi:hypothetical protein
MALPLLFAVGSLCRAWATDPPLIARCLVAQTRSSGARKVNERTSLERVVAIASDYRPRRCQVAAVARGHSADNLPPGPCRLNFLVAQLLQRSFDSRR